MCRSLLSGLLALLAMATGPASAAEQIHPGAGLGVPLTTDQIRAINLNVLPDGTGLPAGSGDAATGAGLYLQHCHACHGSRDQQGANDRLFGGIGSLTTGAPVKTVASYWPYATTLFDYIRKAMPYLAPGSLNSDEVYALTAYLLAENGIISSEQHMDANTLPAVQMPNRNGFYSGYPLPSSN
jgi:cytochrome c